MASLYVIGPVTGIEDGNIAEFERVKEALRIAGHKARIPHEFVGEAWSWQYAMGISIREMLSMTRLSTPIFPHRKYDGVAMLDGWEQSDGAMIEHDTAASLGIPCKPWREWL